MPWNRAHCFSVGLYAPSDIIAHYHSRGDFIHGLPVLPTLALQRQVSFRMGGCLYTDKGSSEVDGDHAVEVFETVSIDCASGKNAGIADEYVERAERFCCFGHSGAEFFGGGAVGF